MKPEKVAIVLFNLGGPLKADDVRGFLFNLFSDKQIIGLPALLRLPLAWWIAKTRAPFAQKNYQLIPHSTTGGTTVGGSPLLKNTQAQAEVIERLVQKTTPNAKVFIAMRYWQPRAKEMLKEVLAFNPDKIVLLPLYPHYSTTTTESSLKEWKKISAKQTPDNISTHSICCWWNDPNFIQAHATLIRQTIEKNPDPNFHLIFSAHGVPQRIIDKGDPYQTQIEKSAALIATAADLNPSQWSLAYQSRVGRLKWLGPETGSEITRLTKEEKKTSLFIVPLSFVSEHIETLVELDIKFKEIATLAGLKNYHRVPTLNCHPQFIEGLAQLIDRSLAQDSLLCSDTDPCTQTY